MSSVSENYYYNLLPANCRKAYSRLLDAVVSFQESANVSDLGLKKGDSERIYQYFCLDHPEVFWLAKQLQLVTCSIGGETICNRFLPQYIFDRRQVKMLQQKISAGAAPIRQAMAKCGNDWDRVLTAHDSLIRLADYTRGKDTDSDHSLIGTLIYHTGVCEAYAETFTWLLRGAGISCITCIGGGHAWNCVTIRGKSALFDVTWDDLGNAKGQNGVCYRCFGLTEKEMQSFHGYPAKYPTPRCETNALSYHYHMGLTASSMGEVQQQVRAALEQRRSFLELRVSPALIPQLSAKGGKRPVWLPAGCRLPGFHYSFYAPVPVTGWFRLEFRYD